MLEIENNNNQVWAMTMEEMAEVVNSTLWFRRKKLLRNEWLWY